MEDRFIHRKKAKSSPKLLVLHPLKTDLMTKPKNTNHKILKHLETKRPTHYYPPSSRTQIPNKHHIESKKLLKRPTIIDAADHKPPPLSGKVLNQLTGKVNALQDTLKTKNKKVLNMKLDKAFLDIEILNNQIQLQKGEAEHTGSYVLQNMYKISRSIEETKAAIQDLDNSNDNLTDYQRFLVQSLGPSSQSQMRVQLSEYSVKEQVSTEFMNAVEELRMLQLTIDKHNSVYDPYIAKLKREIATEKQSKVEKEKELKRVNEEIFSEYGRNIRRNKSETSSQFSRSSSVRRRNEIQIFFFGNLLAKNRSTILSDKRLLEKLEVTFSGVRIGFDPGAGFQFRTLYTDDQGETYEGETHSSTRQPSNIQSTTIDFNSLSRILIQFNKKINSIQFVFNDGLSQQLGERQSNCQKKELDMKDKMMRCIHSYWSQDTLVGLGLEYQKKKVQEHSIINEYFG